MNSLRKFSGFTFLISLFAFLFLATPLLAQTGGLTLAWDPNTETDLQGYRLYYKSQGSGAPYDGADAIVGNNVEPSPSPIVVDPSPSPQITLTGLDPAVDYEFAVTAFNASGESGFSTPVRIFSIRSQAAPNGNVDPQGPVWVESGANKTVAITPDAGFNVADVIVDGASMGARATYTFSSVTDNHSLSADFELQPPSTYTITSQAGANGGVNPNGSIQVAAGADQTVTIQPNSGYQIADVSVNGNSVGAVSSYNFSNVTGDHSLSASFTPLQYTISASAGSNGQVSPNGTTTINHGASQTVSINPNSGYQIADVTVDGNSVGAVSSYNFSNVTGDHTLSASFAQEQAQVYTLTCQAGANGRVSPSGSIQVEAGTSRTVTITPDAGCVVAKVTVDGAPVAAQSSYTFSNIAANHTLSATFTQNTADSDGDGLTDSEEEDTYGSDSQLADSDDDGINDGDEVSYWGNNWNQDIDGDGLANLLDADADDDGYWDGEELANGSDPGDPESKPLELVMESGEVEIDHNWKKVTLNNKYINPVVIANSLSINGGHPSVIRLRNVTEGGFEIRIQEWNYLDGSHTTEKVGYLVMEAGVHTLDDGSSQGLKVIAGHFDTNRTSSYGSLTFPEAFDTLPVVITSMGTYNGSDAVTLRQRRISESAFEYKLQEQESFGSHTTETIGYIACEPTSGTIGESLGFEVGRTDDTVTHQYAQVNFSQNNLNPPVLIAAMQSADGGDTAALRWRNKDRQGVEIKVEEEQSRDSETSHTTESVGYMIFSAE